MAYYKVVQKINNKLFSLVHPSIGIEYEINKWTKPLEGTHLMCLDNLEGANWWKKSYDGEIWECEIIKTKKIPVFLNRGNATTENVLKFIETRN